MLKISIEPKAPAGDMNIVEKGLSGFNFESTQIPYDPRPVNVFLRDENEQIQGGLIGSIFAGWLHVSTLWIDEVRRRQGYGAKLLKTAETEARLAKCTYAWLDTFEFQARPFYEQLGYECFGILNDHPIGHTHYFMYKRL